MNPLSKELMDPLQKFQQRLNSEPPEGSLDKTPDGKASTVVISHIEMTLDELFFGRWSTVDFKWSAITNEVQGSLELHVVHPITGETIVRTGAASVVITVDKVPDEVKDNQQQKNRWALDPSNKKSNALDLAFPKLKAECLKNAAQSLGKIFGRDLNRKNRDFYSPFKIKDLPLEEKQMTLIMRDITGGVDEFEIRNTITNFCEMSGGLYKLSSEQEEHINQLFLTREKQIAQ